MAKASINSGGAVEPVHTRTTSDTVESQVAVIGVDGSDNVVGTPAPADAKANPTNALDASAHGLMWNGATWDRVTGTTANGVDVDVTRLPALPAGTNNIGDVDVLTLPSLPAGNNNIGDVDIASAPALTLGAGAATVGTVLNVGDVDHDAVNTGKVVQTGGHASPVDVPPTLVSANGDRTRQWQDRAGAQVIRRRKIRDSYTAIFRLAETTARLDLTFTFTANTNKQLATLHHTAASTKEVRLMKAWIVPVFLGTVVGVTQFELKAITGTPATGAPAVTPALHRQGGTAAECVALALPTTGGTEATANSPLGTAMIDYGIESGTAPTANPVQMAPTLVLYDANDEDDEELPPILRTGTLEGLAIVGRSTGAVALRFWAGMRWTEEIV